ncbi:hypothetical protein DXG03_006900, partial [Asterophora parasitica]
VTKPPRRSGPGKSRTYHGCRNLARNAGCFTREQISANSTRNCTHSSLLVFWTSQRPGAITAPRRAKCLLCAMLFSCKIPLRLSLMMTMTLCCSRGRKLLLSSQHKPPSKIPIPPH